MSLRQADEAQAADEPPVSEHRELHVRIRLSMYHHAFILKILTPDVCASQLTRHRCVKLGDHEALRVSPSDRRSALTRLDALLRVKNADDRWMDPNLRRFIVLSS